MLVATARSWLRIAGWSEARISSLARASVSATSTSVGVAEGAPASTLAAACKSPDRTTSVLAFWLRERRELQVEQAMEQVEYCKRW